MYNIDQNIKEVKHLRDNLYEAGFHPVAVKTGGKFPTEFGWTTPKPPGDVSAGLLNTGLLSAGLRAVDIDCDDGAVAEKVKDLARAMLPTAPMRSRSNSSRVLFLYRVDEGAPVKRRVQGARHTKEHSEAVEILGDGQQFVAFGQHESGVEYRWDRQPGKDFTAADLPTVTEQQIDEFLEAVRAVIGGQESRSHEGNGPIPDQAGLKGPSLADVCDVVAAMPNTIAGHGDRNLYVGCVAAGLGAAGAENRPEGEIALRDWAERYEGSIDPEDIESTIDSIKPPYRSGWRQLLEHAELEGVDISPWQSAVAQDAFEADGEPPPPQVARRKRYEAQQIGAISTGNSPEVVKGYVGVGEFVAIIGAASSGKTTAVSMIAVAIATGEDCFGHQTLQGAVLVIELEGLRGLASRIRAACIAVGVDIHTLPIHAIGDGFSVAVEADRRELLEAIITLQKSLVVPLRLIVLDTMARAAAGLDENSASDMAVIVRFCDAMREATGAAVILLHHVGLSASERARGSSALRGALDSELLVQRDLETGIGSIRATKMRERELPKPINFRIQSVEIGVDRDGVVITGPVAVAVDSAAAGMGTKPLKGHTLTAMKALTPLLEDRAGVTREVWFAAFESSYPGSGDIKVRRRAFDRAATALVELGRVRIVDGDVMLPGTGSIQPAWAESLNGLMQ